MTRAGLVLGFVLALGLGGAVAQESGTTDGTGEAAEDAPVVRFKKAPFTTRAEQRPIMLPDVETSARGGAVLRKLDKMTGATETVELTSGSEIALDRLRVRLAACEAPEDNAVKGTRAHLTVWDTKTDGDPAFSGWMFADSPALSAMDHPRFDLWVIACTTS